MYNIFEHSSADTRYHVVINLCWVQPIITRFSGGKFGPDHPLYISKEEYDPQVSRCCFKKKTCEIYIRICAILLCDLRLNDNMPPPLQCPPATGRFQLPEKFVRNVQLNFGPQHPAAHGVLRYNHQDQMLVVVYGGREGGVFFFKLTLAPLHI